MSGLHPTPEKILALRRRCIGQEARLRAIAGSILAGEDWTVHLQGLPHVDEVPPVDGEACGRDLRGADLRRWLRPEVKIEPAGEREAALVAALTLEGLRASTPVPGTSPFPVAIEGAEEVAVAMRRGERFLLARSAGRPVGAVRWGARRERMELAGDRAYAEIASLAVLPAWRGLGIGAALLAGAEADAMRQGHTVALLRTAMELGLVPWYERLGYEARRTQQITPPNAPTCLDVLMTRALDAPRPARASAGRRAPLTAAAPSPEAAARR
jgi:predicted N-acetyltransferase YhbS